MTEKIIFVRLTKNSLNYKAITINIIIIIITVYVSYLHRFLIGGDQ